MNLIYYTLYIWWAGVAFVLAAYVLSKPYLWFLAGFFVGVGTILIQFSLK